MRELTDVLHTGQSRLSFHLKVLRDAGLIHDRPGSRWNYQSINSDDVEKVKDLVASLKTVRKMVRPSPRCYFFCSTARQMKREDEGKERTEQQRKGNLFPDRGPDQSFSSEGDETGADDGPCECMSG